MMPYKDLEKRKIQRREWYLRHKEEHLIKVKAYKKRRPEIAAKVQRKHNYGITQEQFEVMVLNQDNRCLICLDEFIKTPNVDHNHSTGEVRGLLCNSCNTGLGRFKDNPLLLQRAAEYLRKGKV